MILDKDTLWADDLAHNSTAEVLDLGSVRPGPGEKLKCFIQGASLAGVTGVTIDHGDADNSLSTLVTLAYDADALNAGPIEFLLPSDIKRYVQLVLTGTTSAGTWTAGIVMEGVQTNL